MKPMDWDPAVRARKELRALRIIAPIMLALSPLPIILGVGALREGDGELTGWFPVLQGALFLGWGMYNAFRIPKVKARLHALEQARAEAAPPA